MTQLHVLREIMNTAGGDKQACVSSQSPDPLLYRKPSISEQHGIETVNNKASHDIIVSAVS